jgi:hypothetical protein
VAFQCNINLHTTRDVRGICVAHALSGGMAEARRPFQPCTAGSNPSTPSPPPSLPDLCVQVVHHLGLKLTPHLSCDLYVGDSTSRSSLLPECKLGRHLC